MGVRDGASTRPCESELFVMKESQSTSSQSRSRKKAAAVTTAAAPVVLPSEDASYEAFLSSVGARLNVLSPDAKLFVVDVGSVSLMDTFLAALPVSARPTYVCRSCQKFMDTYGSVVTIRGEGVTEPLFWDEGVAPAYFREAVRAVRDRVVKGQVSGVFLTSEGVWGTPTNHDKKRGKDWHHLSVKAVPARYVFRSTVLQNAFQASALKREEYDMLSRGLADYPIAVVRTAHEALKNGQLFRSEKCVEISAWLLALHEALDGVKVASRRDKLVWRAVAGAPVGFAHVRSGMIGTLLDDLKAGLPFEDVKSKWAAKMHPLQYLRPTALPSDGNIAQAEKVVGALRTAGALRRRFARLDDVQEWLWQPVKDVVSKGGNGGVFDHLRPKAVPTAPVSMGVVAITWDKFRRTVLPDAVKIETYVDSGTVSLGSLVTAADPTAPPMIQWDRDDKRNPVTWFFYHGGWPAAHWGLKGGTWAVVSGITPYPFLWNGGAYPNHGDGVFVLIEGARDGNHPHGGGLFPEHLKSDYHAVRRTLEAHFQQAVIEDIDTASAAGFGITKGGGRGENVQLRVTTASSVTVYKIDRWD